MRVLVVGSGPAGRRHAELLLELGAEIGIVRRHDVEVETLRAKLGVPVFAGLGAAAVFAPERVVVANAPSDHVETARWAVGQGLPVLVEKPLGVGLEGVDDLLEAAEHAGVAIAVGYNLRFHPALRAVEGAVSRGLVGQLLTVRAEVGSYLPEWHPEDDYRLGSAARAALGGGALLTLSHELDCVLWIAGPARLAGGVRAKVSELELDTDDVAELVLRHDSGALSSVHMDFVDRVYNRRSRWVGEAGTIDWTWGGPVRLYDSGGAVTVLWDDASYDVAETYRAELDAFLRGEAPPGDGLADARRALELTASVSLR